MQIITVKLLFINYKKECDTKFMAYGLILSNLLVCISNVLKKKKNSTSLPSLPTICPPSFILFNSL